MFVLLSDMLLFISVTSCDVSVRIHGDTCHASIYTKYWYSVVMFLADSLSFSRSATRCFFALQKFYFSQFFSTCQLSTSILSFVTHIYTRYIPNIHYVLDIYTLYISNPMTRHSLTYSTQRYCNANNLQLNYLLLL